MVITGFGTFRVSQRAARTGVNPQNPSQKIKIPALKVAVLKAGKALKEESAQETQPLVIKRPLWQQPERFF